MTYTTVMKAVFCLEVPFSLIAWIYLFLGQTCRCYIQAKIWTWQKNFIHSSLIDKISKENAILTPSLSPSPNIAWFLETMSLKVLSPGCFFSPSLSLLLSLPLLLPLPFFSPYLSSSVSRFHWKVGKNVA